MPFSFQLSPCHVVPAGQEKHTFLSHWVITCCTAQNYERQTVTLFWFLSYYFRFLSGACLFLISEGAEPKFLRQYSENVESLLNPFRSPIFDMDRSV